MKSFFFKGKHGKGISVQNQSWNCLEKKSREVLESELICLQSKLLKILQQEYSIRFYKEMLQEELQKYQYQIDVMK